MSVRMRHPDLDGEIAVASSAVPIHALSGWVAVEGQDDMGEELPAELQPFEGQPPIRLHHPDLDAEITVAESAVPFHRERGWLLVEDVELPAESGDLEDLTVAQLQDLAREAGVPVSGTKAELVERLRGQQEQAESEGEETEEDE